MTTNPPEDHKNRPRSDAEAEVVPECQSRNSGPLVTPDVDTLAKGLRSAEFEVPLIEWGGISEEQKAPWLNFADSLIAFGAVVPLDQVLAPIVALAESVAVDPVSLRDLAEKHRDAHAEMLRLNGGVGRLGNEQPAMFEDMLAWDAATVDNHADNVLSLLDTLFALRAALAEAGGDRG